MKKRDELEKLRGMSDEDVREEVARIKESLFRLNFKLALGEMDTVKRMREEKRTLARLQTLMTERQSESVARAPDANVKAAIIAATVVEIVVARAATTEDKKVTSDK